MTGGANNQLYHAQGSAGDLAIKFTLRDRRLRANREHEALQALNQAGSRLAPRPVLLDTTRYKHPVVVQEWLEGPVTPLPPTDEASWQALFGHYLAVHAVAPGNSPVRLRKAVLNFASARQGVQFVTRMASRLPSTARPEGLQALIQRLGAARFPLWRSPNLALCRTDPAPSNFIRRPGGLASVDWENSGWGDPAFEIADLLAHPEYLDVAPGQRERAIAGYYREAPDMGAEARIHSYFCILQVFWVVRLARYLYEVPHGLDERLVDRPPGWEAGIRVKYERYVKKADEALRVLKV